MRRSRKMTLDGNYFKKIFTVLFFLIKKVPKKSRQLKNTIKYSANEGVNIKKKLFKICYLPVENINSSISYSYGGCILLIKKFRLS